MSLRDILYIIAIFMFVFITFGIIKSYYKAKFNDKDQRIDMIDDIH